MNTIAINEKRTDEQMRERHQEQIIEDLRKDVQNKSDAIAQLEDEINELRGLYRDTLNENNRLHTLCIRALEYVLHNIVT